MGEHGGLDVHVRNRSVLWALYIPLVVVGCSPPDESERPIEATSLLDQPLYAPQLSAEFRAEQESLLEQARAELRARPHDPEALIWVGRRQAYLGRYRMALRTYSEGIEEHPDEPRLYRHRGHRHITVREFDQAARDLERAAGLIAGRPDEVEPDGLPNERNIPTSTLGSNVWYHLGLARYLAGDFEGARDAYRECLEFSKNPDMLVATSHWLYMTLRRLGRGDEAREVLEPIHAGMDVIENTDYHQLLLMYKGDREPEELLVQAREAGGVGLGTTAYGVGNWFLHGGDRDRAVEIFRSIMSMDTWAAFGFIAAEAELARLQAGTD
jgi:tetratricopeptide (TPR) repeat protein